MPDKDKDTIHVTVQEEKPVYLPDAARGEIPQDKSSELWTFQGKTVKPGWFVDF